MLKDVWQDVVRRQMGDAGATIQNQHMVLTA